MRVIRYGLAAAILASCPAGARDLPPDCPERPAEQGKAKKIAGQWFSKGESLVQEERYEDAVSAFACSLRIVAHPATMFNAAQAAQLAGKPDEAISYLKDYLEADPDGNMAADAKQLIADLEKQMAAAAEKDTDTDTEKPEEGSGTDTEPQGPAVPTDTTTEQPTDTGVDEDAARAAKLKKAGVVSLGVGGLGVVVGAVFAGLAAKSAADGRTAPTYDIYKDQESRRKAFVGVAVTGFGIGAIAIGTGAVLLVLSKKGEGEKPVALRLVPGPGYLGLSGSF